MRTVKTLTTEVLTSLRGNETVWKCNEKSLEEKKEKETKENYGSPVQSKATLKCVVIHGIKENLGFLFQIYSRVWYIDFNH